MKSRNRRFTEFTHSPHMQASPPDFNHQHDDHFNDDLHHDHYDKYETTYHQTLLSIIGIKVKRFHQIVFLPVCPIADVVQIPGENLNDEDGKIMKMDRMKRFDEEQPRAAENRLQPFSSDSRHLLLPPALSILVLIK